MHAEQNSQVNVSDRTGAGADWLCGDQRADCALPRPEVQDPFLNFLRAGAVGILNANPKVVLCALLIALILTIFDFSGHARSGEAVGGFGDHITAAHRQDVVADDRSLVSAIKTVFRVSTALFCRSSTVVAEDQNQVATAGIRN